MAADTTLTVDVDTRQAISALNSLKGAILGVVTGAAIKGLMDFSDGITSLGNKLRVLGGDSATVSTQFDAIANIAMRARTPLKETGDLFFTIAQASKNLGLSQQDAANMTETLSKTFAMSGLSGAQLSSVLLQIGQGMNAGVFAGDELKSVLENSRPISQALADALGVNVSQLKKLGSEGKITASVFAEAMAKVKGSVDAAFGNNIITFSQAFSTLKTASSVAFNEFEKNTQTGQNLAKAVEYIAIQIYLFSKNIDDVVSPLATFLKYLVAIGGAILTFTLWGRIIRGFALAWEGLMGVVATIRGAFTSLAGIFEELSYVIYKIGKGTFGLGEIFKYILAPIGAVINVIAQLGASVASFLGIKEFIETIGSLGDSNSDASKKIEEARKQIGLQAVALDDKKGVDETAAVRAEELAKKMALVSLAARQQTDDLAINLARVREKLSFDTQQIVNLDEFGNATADLTNKSRDQIEVDTALRDLQYERADAIRKLTQEQEKLNLEFSKLKPGAAGKDSDAGKELQKRSGIIGEQIKREKQLYDQQAKSLPSYIIALQSAKIVEEARKRDTEAQIKLIEDQIARQEKLGDAVRAANQKQFEIKDKTQPEQLVGLTSIERKLIDIQDANHKAGLEAKRAFAEAFGTVETLQQADELTRGINAIDDAYKRLGATEEEYAKGADQVQKAWSTGWADSFASFKEAAFNNADYAKTIFQDATKGMEDAFVNFARTGKLSFKDLADSIIADVIRIGIRRAIASGGEGGVGNIFSAFMGLFKAEGGPVSANSPYIVGEKGPEVFVPTTAGTIVPNGASGGQAMGVTNVNYTIQAVDASSFRSLVARDPQFIYSITEQGRRGQPSRRLN